MGLNSLQEVGCSTSINNNNLEMSDSAAEEDIEGSMAQNNLSTGSLNPINRLDKLIPPGPNQTSSGDGSEVIDGLASTAEFVVAEFVELMPASSSNQTNSGDSSEVVDGLASAAEFVAEFMSYYDDTHLFAAIKIRKGDPEKVFQFYEEILTLIEMGEQFDCLNDQLLDNVNKLRGLLANESPNVPNRIRHSLEN